MHKCNTHNHSLSAELVKKHFLCSADNERHSGNSLNVFEDI